MDIRAEFEASGREWPAIGTFLSSYRELMGVAERLTPEDKKEILRIGCIDRLKELLEP